MTRKEAILYLKWIVEVYGKIMEHGSEDSVKEEWNDHWKKVIESLNMSIEVLKNFDYYKSQCKNYEGTINKLTEALKQEPSTDAVSRQAVLEMAYDMSEIDGEHFTEPWMVVDVEDIQKLPPVTPTRPKGKWIQKEGIYGVSFCDRCNFELTINDTNFCPNCGQDMREGEG